MLARGTSPLAAARAWPVDPEFRRMLVEGSLYVPAAEARAMLDYNITRDPQARDARWLRHFLRP